MAERPEAASFLGAISPEFTRRSREFMLKDLARSGLLPEDLGAEARGFPWPGHPDPCYTIPYFDIRGGLIPQMYRIRMDNQHRYIQPSRDQIGDLANHPYLGKKTALLMNSPVRCICEGEKKAAKFQQTFKIPTLGIGGFQNWRITGTQDVHPVVAEFVRGGSTLLLIPDADYRRPDIGLAYRRLADHFEDKERLLWDATDKIDDYLVAHPEYSVHTELRWVDVHDALMESPEGLQRKYFLTGKTSAQGRVTLDANSANVKKLLEAHPAFKDRVRYNRDENTVEYDLLEGDALKQITMYLQSNLALPSLSLRSAQIAVVEEADSKAYSPRAAWLQSLVWDKVERLDTWVMEHLRVPDSPVAREISKKWLIAAVARLLSEGESIVDFMVILQGAQRIGKSGMIKALFGEKNSVEISKDSSEGKDLQMLYRKWAVIDNEVDHLSRTSAASLKNLITIRTDEYRPPYGDKVKSFVRRCILHGTTNEPEFLLPDETGYRRFGVLQCAGSEIFDFARFLAVREQLWAEARERWKAGEEYSNLDLATEAAKSFVRVDSVVELVHEFMLLAGRSKAGGLELCDHEGKSCVYFTTKYVVEGAGLKMSNTYEMRRVASALRQLGFKKIEQKFIKGKKFGTLWLMSNDEWSTRFV